MVPHGGYAVTNLMTRYAYPAPPHDICSSRGAIFALKMANLWGLRNLQPTANLGLLRLSV